ncbi:hypothetical protein TNCV_1578351 [Trichonephila clavipes]|nr:hypothetical protein TNCV_1578351 [Trichonephila clavipes]
MIPAYNKKRRAAVPFETEIETDFFLEEDTTKSYSGFEPTWMQAEGHSHHTGWATQMCVIHLEKETPNSTTLSKKIAQSNLTASCKRLISWFLLYKGIELGRKIVPLRPPKF